MIPAFISLRLDVVPVEVVGFGSVMLVLLAIVHGAGLDWIVARYRKRSEMLLRKQWHHNTALPVFAATIFLLLFLHIFEINIWGLALYWSGLVPVLRDAMYFSANTYTTIGYGKMVLPQQWQELSPIMAISGLFNFAWTTGLLFELVHQQHELVDRLKALRKGESRAPGAGPVPSADEERLALCAEIEEKLGRLHELEKAALDEHARGKSKTPSS